MASSLTSSSSSSLPLSSSSTTSNKSDKLRALMKRYGIQFDGPVESTPHGECPRNLRTTFDHIKRLGRTGFEQYKEAIAPDLRSYPWKEQVPRRACRVASLANSCRTARKNEASWRLAVESEVMARFAVEVSCKTCRGRLWRSEQEVVPNHESKKERDGMLERRQRNRLPCRCRSDVAKDDVQEQGINLLFDDRADEAILHYPEIQSILGKRKHRPDRIYGLRKTKRLERILCKEDKRKSTPNGRYIGDNIRTTLFRPDGEPILFPFLVIEAKSEKAGAPFSSIEAQTAFAIRELLLVQDELRQAADDEMDWDAAPLVWFLSYRGEQWRVSAAFTKWVNNQRIYRVVRLWHGEIDTKDGALQLLLIIDYICDWARDKYREAVIQGLRSLAANDTKSLAHDSDIFSTFDPTTLWSPWVPAQENHWGPVLGSIEIDPFRGFDNEVGAIRDVRYIRSHLLGIYLTEDNFDYFMDSTDSEEDSRELAREILTSLKTAWRVERTALDLLELIWTGKDCCGSDADHPPDKGFLVVSGIGAYLSPEWEQSRTIFYFAVAESLIGSLSQVAEVGPMQYLGLLGAPKVDDELFSSCFSRYKRHPARDNLLACFSRSYVNLDAILPHSTRKSNTNTNSGTTPNGNTNLSPTRKHFRDDSPPVGQVVHQIYKRHCIGRCKPTSSLFRISDRLDLVPLVDCPVGEDLEVLSTPIWPLAEGVPDTKSEKILFAVSPSQGSPKKGAPRQCIFVMDPSERSAKKQMERIRQNNLSWQFSAKKFDLQRKWIADWNITDVLVPPKSQSLLISELKASFTQSFEGCSTETEEETKNAILQDKESSIGTVAAAQPASQAADTDPTLLKRLEADGFVELSFNSSQLVESNRQIDPKASEASSSRSDLHVDINISAAEPSRENDPKRRPDTRITRSMKRQSQLLAAKKAACSQAGSRRSTTSIGTRPSGVQLEISETRSEVLGDEELDEDVKTAPRKRKMGQRDSALTESSTNASAESVGSSLVETKRRKEKATTGGPFPRDFLDDGELRRLIDEGFFSK